VRIAVQHAVRGRGARTACLHRQSYTLYPDGHMCCKNEVRLGPEYDDPYRVGVELVVPAGFERIEWYGRGPHENYRDRKAGARLGRYRDTVTNRYVPYIRPQETGNHTATRWLCLEDEHRGAALRVRADDALEFTASHFTAGDLHTAEHTHELTPRPEIILHLDLHQRGIGTASCGPDTLDEYRLRPGRYTFTYWLEAGDAPKTG
jgi:beta-galactosidase